MKTNTLPSSVVQMLRGEISDSTLSELAGLGREYYRDGKAGETFKPVTVPGSVPGVADAVNRFLLACWNQGRETAA